MEWDLCVARLKLKIPPHSPSERDGSADLRESHDSCSFQLGTLQGRVGTAGAVILCVTWTDLWGLLLTRRISIGCLAMPGDIQGLCSGQ